MKLLLFLFSAALSFAAAAQDWLRLKPVPAKDLQELIALARKAQLSALRDQPVKDSGAKAD